VLVNKRLRTDRQNFRRHAERKLGSLRHEMAKS
jgi:hypothetical protein